MDSTETISSIALSVAITALVYQMYQSNKQARLQNFSNYTQRYQDIFLNLPIQIESINFNLNKIGSEEKELILRRLRAYFDLCSEEYYLNQNNYIDKKVWILWKSHDSAKLNLLHNSRVHERLTKPKR